MGRGRRRLPTARARGVGPLKVLDTNIVIYLLKGRLAQPILPEEVCVLRKMNKSRVSLCWTLSSLCVFSPLTGCKQSETCISPTDAPPQPKASASINDRNNTSQQHEIITPSFEQRKLEFASKRRESELINWKSGPDQDRKPRKSLRDCTISIEGDWLRGGHLETTTLDIKRIGPSNYSIEFYTTGCLSRWKLSRTATYSDGVVKFDRPVQEYVSRTYDRLYAIRIAGEECLIPPCNIVEIEKWLDENHTEWPEDQQFKWWTLGRRKVRLRY